MKIPLFKVFMASTAPEEVGKILMSGYVGQGPKVEELEKNLRDYIGSPYISTVNSGTSALHLALHVLKPNSGRDEVLTTPLTCTATNFPILANGLKIRWIDVDLNTCNLDLTDLRRKISPKTACIMAVHWGGLPVDLNELKKIQDECFDLYGFRPPIIEDCAHAMGATYDGKHLGNHGNTCMFSFQAIKHFTTSDGGMLIAPSDEIHKRFKLLRWYGLDRTTSADFRCEQNISDWGFKFHMNDVCATIGIENLKHTPQIIAQHKENGRFFDEEFSKFGNIQIQEQTEKSESSYWVYTIRVEDRDGFIRKMTEKGISVSRVHDRNDKHLCLKEFKTPLPNTDKICEDMICIPCGWWIHKAEREYIVDCIEKGW